MKISNKKKERIIKNAKGIADYMVECPELLKLLDKGIKHIGLADSNRDYISDYNHAKLMAGITVQLRKLKFFKEYDEHGREIKLRTVILFLQKRYHTPYLQRCYRDREECRQMAVALVPVLKEIEEALKCYFFKTPKTH